MSLADDGTGGRSGLAGRARKVLVIGPGGAGKSTLAAAIAERTGLPVIHLDALYWRPGWVPTPNEEWDAVVAELAARDAWVMDGNYSRTLEPRLGACDAVVFLDLPRRLCLWRLVRRRLQFHRRPDMAAGCRERLTWEFVRWVWAYPRRSRPRVRALLAAAAREGKHVVVLRSAAAVDRFLASLTTAAPPPPPASAPAAGGAPAPPAAGAPGRRPARGR